MVKLVTFVVGLFIIINIFFVIYIVWWKSSFSEVISHQDDSKSKDHLYIEHNNRHSSNTALLIISCSAKSSFETFEYLKSVCIINQLLILCTF